MTCLHDVSDYRKDHHYEEGYLVEYNVYCAECDALIGNMAYGTYTDYTEEEN